MSTEDKKTTAQQSESDLQHYMQSIQPIEEGQMIPGRVVEITGDYVYIDVGYKSEGKIPLSEFEAPPQIGENVYVILIRKEGKEGQVIVSKRRAGREAVLEEPAQGVRRAQAHRGPHRPAREGRLGGRSRRRDPRLLPRLQGGRARPTENADYVGTKSPFYIDRLYAKGKTNIVVSRRDWMEENIKRRKDEFFANTQIGDVVEGMVKSFTSFGAFVDLGGFDGLLHINDMSWGHVTRPKDFVRLGEPIQLKVIRLEPTESRINLSLKHFTEDPWNHFEEKYHVGDVVKGRTTKLADFGAFIEIEEGIEGLAHISELSWVRKVKHPREVLKVGDVVETKILGYDVQQGKLSLGLKQVLPNPWDEIDQRYPVGMRLTRTRRARQPVRPVLRDRGGHRRRAARRRHVLDPEDPQRLLVRQGRRRARGHGHRHRQGARQGPPRREAALRGPLGIRGAGLPARGHHRRRDHQHHRLRPVREGPGRHRGAHPQGQRGRPRARDPRGGHGQVQGRRPGEGRGHRVQPVQAEAVAVPARLRAKVQREEMDKYIHDESKEDTVALGDLLKDRIKG